MINFSTINYPTIRYYLSLGISKYGAYDIISDVFQQNIFILNPISTFKSTSTLLEVLGIREQANITRRNVYDTSDPVSMSGLTCKVIVHNHLWVTLILRLSIEMSSSFLLWSCYHKIAFPNRPSTIVTFFIGVFQS